VPRDHRAHDPAAEGRGPALQELLGLARRRGVKVSYRTRDQLSAMAGTPHHQGVVARVAGASYASLDELLAIPGLRSEPAFFLALDQIQDPRNLGAILRSAEATGAHGAIVPKHNAATLPIVNEFVHGAKRDGLTTRLMVSAGLRGVRSAP